MAFHGSGHCTDYRQAMTCVKQTQFALQMPIQPCRAGNKICDWRYLAARNRQTNSA